MAATLRNRSPDAALDRLMAEIKLCRVCEAHLPLGPKPALRGRPSARLLILSQAPGTRVHETGLSFNDRSGDRLRDWLGIDRAVFYDEERVAVMPLVFCFPGRDKKGGDLPPRRECAPLWHERMLTQWPNLELTVLAGSYAIDYYLQGRAFPTMTETVRHWRDYGPRFIPVPHPSWRTTFWEKKNPWFARQLLPEMRRCVADLV